MMIKNIIINNYRASRRSLVVERNTCNVEVTGSTPVVGFNCNFQILFIFTLITIQIIFHFSLHQIIIQYIQKERLSSAANVKAEEAAVFSVIDNGFMRLHFSFLTAFFLRCVSAKSVAEGKIPRFKVLSCRQRALAAEVRLTYIGVSKTNDHSRELTVPVQKTELVQTKVK
ncbi:Hypothetical_protein [Hexamita inflata]|uniref:Hypothetical_protein n=1 Tax=Hexamita inflata TaxID=28002 RepID=A0AA86UHE4_9EUKA|nr:Hypothetical protein HINF_LOCUS45930 [Hexamita inflata]